MELTLMGEDIWNSFIVSIPREDEESERNYFLRVVDHLEAFYAKHTTFDPLLKNPPPFS